MEAQDAERALARGKVTTKFGTSPEFKEKREALGIVLRKRLDQLGLRDTGLQIVDWLKAAGENQPEEFWSSAGGSHNPILNLIRVALDSKTGPQNVIDHEAVHAMRNLGLINDGDWKILEKKSAAKWLAKYGIEQTYAGLSRDKLLEEGVAHAFPDHVAGRLAPEGNAVTRIFRKIANFFEAVRNAFNGFGFKSADDIFTSMDRGEHTAPQEPGFEPRKAGDIDFSKDDEKPLTEKQFHNQYMQHIDMRGRRDGTALENREAILRDGFKRKGGNVNALPTSTGAKTGQWAPRAGDVVYLAQKGAWKDAPNGPEIQEGWKPKPYEAVVVTEGDPVRKDRPAPSKGIGLQRPL